MNEMADIHRFHDLRGRRAAHVRQAPRQRPPERCPSFRKALAKADDRQGAPHSRAGLAELWRGLLPRLDGMLELSRRLAENDGNRLSPRQVDYAQTLYSSTSELHWAMARMLAGRGLEAPREPPALDGRLAGLKLLLVARDMRGVYPLTGALEQHGIRVVHATGVDELDSVLAGEGGLDAVLLDDEDAGLDVGRLLLRIGEAGPGLPVFTLAACLGGCARPGRPGSGAEAGDVTPLLTVLARRLGGAGPGR